MTEEPDRNGNEANRLRSANWFGAYGRAGMIYRSWMRNQGFGADVFDGRPVIGIAKTWSELTPCNAHLHRVAEAVKRGVWQAGGFPLEFPTMSPRRDPHAADRDALPQPDGHGGRGDDAGQPARRRRAAVGVRQDDPGLLMGAASVDLPAIMVTGGPMLNGKYRGEDVGSGTHVWKFEAETERRADDPGGVRPSPRAAWPALRPLHDDGHRLDDGLPGRGARACSCPARRRGRPPTRAAC